jgi:hypothetical protein
VGAAAAQHAGHGAGYNVLPIWKDRLDAKTLITTPNSDVLYAMSYADLGETGPLVFEAPPRMQGILLDFWQRPIPGPQLDASKVFAGDVGFFGPDEGKGGKFLILPPGYNDAVPAGYYVFRSGTKNVFIFLRAFFEDPRELAPAVQLLEEARFYPLGQERTAKPMQFPNASGVPVNMLPRSDSIAFDQLKWLIDREPDSLADEGWLGMLASIGIERGKPFQPDAARRRILDRAAETGYKMSRAVGFESTVGGVEYRLYPDRRWLNPWTSGYPFDLAWTRILEGYRALDNRVWFFTDYYSISPGMLSKTPGVGANYLIAFADSAGAPLQGERSYALHLPPKIPAAVFWSLTLYDAANGSGLDNGQPFPSLGSRDNPEQEQDGSTVLYLGPKAPEGKVSNWLRTVPDKDYFVILRLYGPLEAAIDHTWKPRRPRTDEVSDTHDGEHHETGHPESTDPNCRGRWCADDDSSAGPAGAGADHRRGGARPGVRHGYDQVICGGGGGHGLCLGLATGQYGQPRRGLFEGPRTGAAGRRHSRRLQPSRDADRLHRSGPALHRLPEPGCRVWRRLLRAGQGADRLSGPGLR